jgi:hypothetical protein
MIMDVTAYCSHTIRERAGVPVLPAVFGTRYVLPAGINHQVFIACVTEAE